ncbi:hypothetical protein EGW08_011041 [Elysia chlorotica]|uniref:HAT C-terminal dimerisation domain-containing protein n=1 Tax=Elysia chlorotica TaxID=188477 RepID=A0A433TI47_ELYCH|nr:hypothetical protein EGW08_011041 [Elysia chlorotica]
MFLNSDFKAEDIIRQYSCARTKTTCIVHKLAEPDRLTLIQSCSQALTARQLTLRTTKMKNSTHYPIVICMEREGDIKTELLSILKLKEKGTDLNIANLIMDCLSKPQIPLEHCVALTTDNANVMIGAKSAVGAFDSYLADECEADTNAVEDHDGNRTASSGKGPGKPEVTDSEALRHLPGLCLAYINAANLTFQREDSQIHKQRRLMIRLIKDLMTMFLKPSCLLNKQLFEIDYRAQSNTLKDSDLMIAVGAFDSFFADECEADTNTVKDLDGNRTASSGRKEKVLENLSSRTVKLYVTYLSYVLPIFYAANLTFQREDSQIHKQRRLMIRLIKDLMTMFLKPSCLLNKQLFEIDYRAQKLTVGLQQLPITEFWLKVGGIKDELGELLLPDLPTVMLRILAVPHSKASYERFFSLVRKNTTDFRASIFVNQSSLTDTTLLVFQRRRQKMHPQKKMREHRLKRETYHWQKEEKH